MADVTKLRELIEAYGVGVRAGVITPCLEDENEFRKWLGLQAAPAAVVSDWGKTDGVRKPITLQQEVEPKPAQDDKGKTNEV